MPKIIEVPGQGRVEFPDDMSDDQIVAAIKSNSAPAYDPSEGGITLRPFGIDTGLEMPQGVSRFLAGTGKAFVDTGRGVGQLVRDGLGASAADAFGLPDRASVDESKKLDAPLMNTGAGMTGNIFGNVAVTAPLAMIPGANTIAGGALIGAGSGAMQPVGKDDSRLTNMAIGTAAGAAVPAAIRTAKALRAGLVDPFTDAGRTRIAAKVISRATSNPAAVAEKLRNARGVTPGFMPTAGQAADDAGVASLERTVRAIDPRGFDEVEKSQRGALVDALRNIAQTPEARAAAVNAREGAVAPLYDAAKRAVVDGDDDILSLLRRPSMSAAQDRAGRIAAERGEQFVMRPGTADQIVPTGLFDAQGNAITRVVPGTPGKYSGSALHDLKMGLDDAIGSPELGGMQGAERNAAVGTKEKFMDWLEAKIPEYGQAKSTYAGMSQPINQMDIGTELYKRFTPALADQGGLPFKSTADAYAKALRNGDDLARNVTKMKSATLGGIMTPEQMATLQGVAKDSATRAAAENAGRGAGSDTVQKIAMSNMAAEAGVPNWLAKIGSVPGGWAKRVGDALYGDADNQIRSQLSELLRDPQKAAQAMRAAGASPSKIAEWLKLGAQSSAIALPASVQPTK